MPEAATIENLSARITNASRSARDADEHAEAERERRDRLIVEGMRQGLGYRQLCELTGLGRTSIIRIIASNG